MKKYTVIWTKHDGNELKVSYCKVESLKKLKKYYNHKGMITINFIFSGFLETVDSMGEIPMHYIS